MRSSKAGECVAGSTRLAWCTGEDLVLLLVLELDELEGESIWDEEEECNCGDELGEEKT